MKTAEIERERREKEDTLGHTSSHQSCSLLYSILDLLYLVLYCILCTILCLICCLIFFVVIVFTAGQIALLYALYFAGKEYDLDKEYLSSGVAVDGFCSQCVAEGEDMVGDSWYCCSFKYYPPSYNDNKDDGRACYITKHKFRQMREIGEQEKVLILPGIPSSGRIASSIPDSKECFIRFTALGMSIWGPISSFFLATLFLSECQGDECVISLETWVVYGIILCFVFLCMSCVYSRSALIPKACQVPPEQILSVVVRGDTVSSDDDIATFSTILTEEIA